MYIIIYIYYIYDVIKLIQRVFTLNLTFGCACMFILNISYPTNQFFTAHARVDEIQHPVLYITWSGRGCIRYCIMCVHYIEWAGGVLGTASCVVHYMEWAGVY